MDDQQPKFLVTMNFNRIRISDWMEPKKLPNGNYEYIGKCRRQEFDADTGRLVSDVVSETGIRLIAPACFVEGPRKGWLDRLIDWLG